MFVHEGARMKLMERRQEQFYTDFVQPMVREASRLNINIKNLHSMIERGVSDDNSNQQPE